MSPSVQFNSLSVNFSSNKQFPKNVDFKNLLNTGYLWCLWFDFVQ